MVSRRSKGDRVRFQLFLEVVYHRRQCDDLIRLIKFLLPCAVVEHVGIPLDHRLDDSFLSWVCKGAVQPALLHRLNFTDECLAFRFQSALEEVHDVLVVWIRTGALECDADTRLFHCGSPVNNTVAVLLEGNGQTLLQLS